MNLGRPPMILYNLYIYIYYIIYYIYMISVSPILINDFW